MNNFYLYLFVFIFGFISGMGITSLLWSMERKAQGMQERIDSGKVGEGEEEKNE